MRVFDRGILHAGERQVLWQNMREEPVLYVRAPSRSVARTFGAVRINLYMVCFVCTVFGGAALDQLMLWLDVGHTSPTLLLSRKSLTPTDQRETARF